jgi:ADP-ribose pyrophosphatase YjhB (NUDIX family)
MRWVKSSFSKGDGDCVELGTDNNSTVLVRNSQHPERGTLALPAVAVAAFVAACAAGEMDQLPV